MRTLGLIGGMSFESTAVYYRLINEDVRARLGGFHSAEMILHSVDFAPVVAMQQAARWTDAGKCLARAAQGLEQAGAACVLICANTMHLVADAVAAAISVPLIHIIDETARALNAAGTRRPLLLATRYTMEHGFYAERMTTHGVDVVLPDPADRARIHDIIFQELCAGRVVDRSRDDLIGVIAKAASHGADSVILGCTEFGLTLNPQALPLPAFDSTVIHCAAAVDFALGAA